MTRYVPFAAAAVALAVAAPAAAQNADLAAITAHLKAVSSMTADFTQIAGSGKTSTGQLFLKRPGRIRVQYEKAVPILLVSDGKALTYIDYSVKQVQRWPIGNSPLGVLLNPDRDMTRFARVIPAGSPNGLFLEARDPKHAEFGTITLAFRRQPSAPAGLMLMGWEQLDNQNNRTVMRLANQRFNVPVSDETFKWRDPRPSGPRR